MLSIDILNAIGNFRRDFGDSNYLLKLEEEVSKIEEFQTSENEHILAAINVYYCYNLPNAYIVDEIPENYLFYRKIRLNSKQYKNLLFQMKCIEEDDFYGGCGRSFNNEDIEFYFVLTNEFLNIEELNKDISKIFLGIHSFDFLNHQNIENYCSEKIIKGSSNFIKEFYQFRRLYSNLAEVDKNRILILSGSCFQILGALYTKDLDYLLISNDKNFTGHFSNIGDPNPTGKNTIKNQYQYNFLNYIFPKLAGAEDLIELILNPRYHNYYMGVKFLDSRSAFIKNVTRGSRLQILDAYLLKKYNDLDYTDLFCYPNIVIRQGKAVISNNKRIKSARERISKEFIEWYGYPMDMDFFDKYYISCQDKYGTIYYGEIKDKDKITYQITSNRKIVNNLIYKYGKGLERLLDIGSGKFAGADIYEKAGIREVVGIEPSKQSIEKSKENIQKYPKISFNICNSRGDVPLEFDCKFPIITITFSIHYMFKNIDILMQNIMNASISGTKVIISMLDGEYILNKMEKSGKLEYKYENDIYYGVYQFNDKLTKKNPEVLFYIKNVYGLENGSIEPLVGCNQIIEVFENYGFELIEKGDFVPKKKLYPKFLNQILRFHKYLVFERS